MKNHIRSFVSSRSVVHSWVSDWIKIYGDQELYHVQEIQVGGKLNHYTGLYQGAEKKYIVVDFPKAKEMKAWDDRWIAVDDIEQWQEENGIDYKAVNHAYLLDNKGKWLVDIDEIDARSVGVNPKIKPIEVDENREGLYGVYSERGKLHYIVDMTMENMFSFFDKLKRYAVNFTLSEMVENGYVSIKSQMSWLGQNGKNIHAVEAYHRVIGEDIVYFSLQTWCSGNHWLSNEHSPVAEYPSEDKVTCKKCLKKMEKKKKMGVKENANN